MYRNFFLRDPRHHECTAKGYAAVDGRHNLRYLFGSHLSIPPMADSLPDILGEGEAIAITNPPKIAKC